MYKRVIQLDQPRSYAELCINLVRGIEVYKRVTKKASSTNTC